MMESSCTHAHGSGRRGARLEKLIRRRLQITGVVQGVGFRPFVYALARRFELAGFVGNESSGVFVEAEGSPERLDAFERALTAEAPPLARIESLVSRPLPALGESAFFIVASEARARESTPVPADIATCDACLREMRDPADRRYRYPFLNCTNCGPRFTITRDLPYDRAFTTMSGFAMCPACEAEYHDPANRRFHAEPTACPRCGPTLRFQPGGMSGEDALSAALAALSAGAIVAVKGIGGFHLACDATRDAAVRSLRERKRRGAKPFALMARGLDHVRQFASVDEEEAHLLTSPERPIVLLRRLDGAEISPLVAPANPHLGFMLPYTPLHHLLLNGPPLVMTSGNRADEPIARDNEEALHRLQGLADAFLLHDREIHAVCDDSVVRVFEGAEMPVRRSRGYAPLPVRLPSTGPSVLAVGGELKAAFCLTKDDRAYLSQHIGDMENLETMEAFERAFHHFRRLFRAEPEVVAADLHPGYLSSQWAQRYAAAQRLPLVRVQHHHAHVAGLVTGHGIEEPVIGVSFDGTGYGADGAVWGGEFLVVDGAGCERAAHLKYVPLPGGDAAVRHPARMALAHLWAAGIEWDPDLPPVAALPDAARRVLRRQLVSGLRCAPTSSMGRLFDAVASLTGLRHSVDYEAQAAMELEAACAGDAAAYEFHGELDAAPVLRAIVADLRAGVTAQAIAARFHNGVAAMIAHQCASIRRRTGLARVALTGGVFQNMRLLAATARLLRGHGMDVLVHRATPPNDGGLALGQAAVACNARALRVARTNLLP